jgi:epoxyqueuosine reductase QueG
MQFDIMIREVIEEECEDYFLGITDLSIAKKVIIEQYESLISIYPRAISIGITLPYEIIDELLKSNCNVIYNETNNQLNTITSYLSSLLEKDGYKALAVPKSGRIDNGLFISLHNITANLADLGWIEKNMIVTPEVGPGVNWGTLLTDAPIEAID